MFSLCGCGNHFSFHVCVYTSITFAHFKYIRYFSPSHIKEADIGSGRKVSTSVFGYIVIYRNLEKYLKQST